MQRRLYSWQLPRGPLELGKRTLVMGILNVTPDSFSDGGLYVTAEMAIARGRQMEQDGADIIDVGGESTRPGSHAVPEGEELRRVQPVVEALCAKTRIPISIDTWRSGIARTAVDAGAQIVNDISGFRFDPGMAELVRASGSGVVLMHSRGARDELHNQPAMADPVALVKSELARAAEVATAAGIHPSAIVLDPGIGFGKRAEESEKVLRHFDALTHLQYPLLAGTSRKSFIRRIVGGTPGALLWGTIATVAAAVERGAHIVRVHDIGQVRAVVDVLDVISAHE